MTASRAAIYTCIANDGEGRELGVARQETDCREAAARGGIQVVGVYSDSDTGAATSSRAPRPECTRMLMDAEAGRFETVLVYSQSRLTRRPCEIEDFIELHQEVGTQLLTTSGPVNLGTADGRTNTRLLGSIDTGEAERTAERARHKQKELAVSGRHNGRVRTAGTSRPRSRPAGHQQRG